MLLNHSFHDKHAAQPLSRTQCEVSLTKET